MRAYRRSTDKDDEDRRTAGAARHASASPVTDVLAMQGLVGNAAVASAITAQSARQAAPADGEREAGPAARVEEVLRSAGQPLPEPVRTDMEQRLGADFGDVRVHTDDAARRSAEELGARAYTAYSSGDHVVIGAGGDDPHTMAHELAHVVQQRQGPVAGADNGRGVRVSDPSDAFERAAEAAAHRAMSGEPVQAPAHPTGSGHGTEPVLQLATLGGAAPPPAPAAAPAAPQVTIAEGGVAAAPAGATIRYPAVTSCLTITVVMRDGSMYGAHASLYRLGTNHRSDEILQALRTLLPNRWVLRPRTQVESIQVRGVTDMWLASYLEPGRSIEALQAAGQPVPQPVVNQDPRLAGVVAGALGRQADKVQVTTTPGQGDVLV